MGSPLSPIIADLLMQDLKKKAIESIGLELSFYYCYVDEIILLASREQVNNILNNFNNIQKDYRSRDTVVCLAPSSRVARDEPRYHISITAERIELIISYNAYPNYIIKVCLFLLYVL